MMQIPAGGEGTPAKRPTAQRHLFCVFVLSRAQAGLLSYSTELKPRTLPPYAACGFGNGCWYYMPCWTRVCSHHSCPLYVLLKYFRQQIASPRDSCLKCQIFKPLSANSLKCVRGGMRFIKTFRCDARQSLCSAHAEASRAQEGIRPKNNLKKTVPHHGSQPICKEHRAGG
ncbi:unnamed protein product [Natator depressus]